jgi:hypothetical protein
MPLQARRPFSSAARRRRESVALTICVTVTVIAVIVGWMSGADHQHIVWAAVGVFTISVVATNWWVNKFQAGEFMNSSILPRGDCDQCISGNTPGDSETEPEDADFRLDPEDQVF